jgi:hypothetical protein
MSDTKQVFGFTYFASPEYFVSKKISTWMPAISDLGASVIVLHANFNRAIPEDVFLCAKDNQLVPVVQFSSELPLARKFNEVAFLLEVYAKWGVNEVIFGNKPNMKHAWPIAGWHYESLVDHFLDRYIPLATQAIRLGLTPAAPPLQPGGDYWDTAFMELFLRGLNRRHLSEILEHLSIASYGYTFDKPLDWGRGGPERWSVSKPYQSAEGEQDQLGFHHFEWMQAIGQKATGKTLQTMILDAGNPGKQYSQADPLKVINGIRRIMDVCRGLPVETENGRDVSMAFNETTRFCAFGLDTIVEMMPKPFEAEHLVGLFRKKEKDKASQVEETGLSKPIKHYLLLPLHGSGVSDAILNKVRPLIKAYQPTIGFSIQEAALAETVSVYPDQGAFPSDALNQLRNSGSIVKILPESGIEIATSLQNTQS